MNPAEQRFIELLGEDVAWWEQAAENIEHLLHYIPSPDRERWTGTAQAYRKRAAEHKSLVEQYKKANKMKG